MYKPARNKRHGFVESFGTRSANKSIQPYLTNSPPSVRRNIPPFNASWNVFYGLLRWWLELAVAAQENWLVSVLVNTFLSGAGVFETYSGSVAGERAEEGGEAGSGCRRRRPSAGQYDSQSSLRGKLEPEAVIHDGLGVVGQSGRMCGFSSLILWGMICLGPCCDPWQKLPIAVISAPAL